MLPQGTSSIQKRQRKPINSFLSSSNTGYDDYDDKPKPRRPQTSAGTGFSKNLSAASFGVVGLVMVIVLVGVVLISIDNTGQVYKVEYTRKQTGSKAWKVLDEARDSQERALDKDAEALENRGIRPVSDKSPEQKRREANRNEYAQQVRAKWHKRMEELRGKWDKDKDGNADRDNEAGEPANPDQRGSAEPKVDPPKTEDKQKDKQEEVREPEEEPQNRADGGAVKSDDGDQKEESSLGAPPKSEPAEDGGAASQEASTSSSGGDDSDMAKQIDEMRKQMDELKAALDAKNNAAA